MLLPALLILASPLLSADIALAMRLTSTARDALTPYGRARRRRGSAAFFAALSARHGQPFSQLRPRHSGPPVRLGAEIPMAMGPTPDFLDWGEEPFQRQEHIERDRARVALPCKRGRGCVTPGCDFMHPEVERFDPGEKNAVVVVLRQGDKGEVYMLLQRRGFSTNQSPGLLAPIGGKREESDRDSMETAIREVSEETGLLDLGRLVGAPKAMRRVAEEAEETVQAPRRFRIYCSTDVTDFWVLLLAGQGSFGPAPDASACADITPLLPELPGAVAAPQFGHAWVPVESILRLKNLSLATTSLRKHVRLAVNTILFD
eukprot:CAMPEP_0176254462 /NCGR_PEP_ID=MMETSP0121_2-20121125/36544_1 /TAXON_ID=160619 /ORGANISM="Kryptoperidinium foliaceum, Strain CCMP 1326" /LENGTH=316 /DNA_ID=CAMNT_0017594271 /DNA_START=1 /DNA_END=951 /DNA_ORIENTATION=+